MDLYEIQAMVSKKQSHERFCHTLGVQTTSFSLAIVNNEDYNKAILAGLLHDLAKSLPDHELINECKKHHIAISEIEYISPYLLHGKLGAFYAKEQFCIKDEDILNAITYHTTGRPKMSTLEKIIFVADYIEPNRRQDQIPHLSKIRETAFSDLDRSLLLILSNTIEYLNKKNKVIDTLTMDSYNYYKSLYN